MLTIDNLLEIEQIRLLKYRYVRALDTHDMDLMRSLFTDDISVWLTDGKYTFSGIERVMDFYIGIVTDDLISSHYPGCPEIELTSPTTATGIWRFEDTVHFRANVAGADMPGIEGGEELNGAGYYYDDYEKTANGWKIKRTGYHRIFERIEKRGQRVLSLDVGERFGRRLTGG